jgi:hypothetical protein
MDWTKECGPHRFQTTDSVNIIEVEGVQLLDSVTYQFMKNWLGEKLLDFVRKDHAFQHAIVATWDLQSKTEKELIVMKGDWIFKSLEDGYLFSLIKVPENYVYVESLGHPVAEELDMLDFVIIQ